jgi:hypothetical protein
MNRTQLTKTAPVLLAAAVFAASSLVAGCGSSQKEMSEPSPEQVAAVAELERQTAEATEKADTLAREARDLRDRAADARADAARNSAEARSLRVEAARDEVRADAYFHDAAVLRADGHLQFETGFVYEDHYDETRALGVSTRATQAVEQANAFKAMAEDLEAGADVKRTQADARDAAAERSLARAESLQADLAAKVAELQTARVARDALASVAE